MVSQHTANLCCMGVQLKTKGCGYARMFGSFTAGKSQSLYIYKAAVSGLAGPASAGPLFWPSMLLAVPLFFFNFSLFCCAYLWNCLIALSKVPHLMPVLLMQLSITFVARFTYKPVQGVKTKTVTRRAKHCNHYNDTCLISIIFKGLVSIDGISKTW